MSAHFKNPFVWLYGLAAAVIGGAASAAVAWLGTTAAKAAGVDVPALNLKALGIILLSSGLFHAFTYLMKSPLPALVQEDTAIFKKEEQTQL